MNLRTCTLCLRSLSTNFFHKKSSGRDGISPWCKDCKCAKARTHYLSNREKIIKRTRVYNKANVKECKEKVANYLSQHPCVDCGETDIVVLDFDHLKNKKANVSRLVATGRKWTIVLREINKCEVRCANCHRRKTAKHGNWYKLLFSTGAT